jgi:hypothetical protein
VVEHRRPGDRDRLEGGEPEARALDPSGDVPLQVAAGEQPLLQAGEPVLPARPTDDGSWTPAPWCARPEELRRPFWARWR